jgi:hypothetical protein
MLLGRYVIHTQKNATSSYCGLSEDCKMLPTCGLSLPAPVINVNMFLLLILKELNFFHAFLITTAFLE